MRRVSIAVLVSGGGTNLQALLDAQRAGLLRSGEIRLVLSSRPGVRALARAAAAGVPAAVVSRTECDQAAFEAALRARLDAAGAEVIVLAGFLSILSADFTRRYAGRILNVHPSLIPAFCGAGFYGLRVHRAVLDAGVQVTGATVHEVNEIPDGGRILAQKAVDVAPDDTPETLQRRVMEQAEWVLLPRAVEAVCRQILEREESNMENLGDIGRLLRGNDYPGRGILLGRTPDGKRSVAAYFIMGRSANSRNRVFLETPDGIRTEAHDPAQLADPSLILYHPVRKLGRSLIVTNGDQTDTVRDALEQGQSFEAALRTRTFEPDAPNWTPRISGLLLPDGSFRLSILRCADADGRACERAFFEYPGLPGQGRFLHTYRGDGNPLPSFTGDPEAVAVPDDIDEFTNLIWDSLHRGNKISLYVRYADLASGEETVRIRNKHREEHNS